MVLLTYEDSCAFLWAGDSRLYLLRSGQLQRLTKDHSHVQELVDAGMILPEDAEHHPASNVITRAVGASERLELDSGRITLRDRDTFLLCSDGLYKDVSETEIADILSHSDEDRACDILVDLALSRACRDNVSAVVVNVHSTENPPAQIDQDQTVRFTNHSMEEKA